MRGMFSRLRMGESGATYTIEILLVATLLVIGVVVGLGRVRGAVATELNDVANATGSLNQGFIVPPFDACAAKLFTAGSGFQDGLDEGDCAHLDTGGQVKDHNGNVVKVDVTSSQG